jgi:hypothetical protein
MGSDLKLVATAFGEMGLSLRAVFPDPIERTYGYGDYRWEVVRTKTHLIVHAIPPADKLDEAFWEEWYTVDGGPVTHHILFSSQPPVPFHDIFDPPEQLDGIHPEEIFGRRWYVVEDPHMLAWGVRNLLAIR